MAKKTKVPTCVGKETTPPKRKPRPFVPPQPYFRSKPMTLEAERLRKARRAAPDLITNEAMPEVAIFKPCERKGPGKELRAGCHVELAFIGKTLSNRENVAPGAYLRVCTRYGKPGLLVPVADHADALTKSRSICECQDAGGSRESCARQAGAKTLGALRRRR